MKKIRWGVLGCGNIVRLVAPDFRFTDNAELYAVASRDAGKAKDYAKRYGAQKYYGDYQGLLADPDVDVVYIATPHIFHLEQAKMVLEAGKALCCEKPLTINEAQGRELMELADRKGLYAAEAFWTVYFPAVAAIRNIISSSALGKLLRIEANLCFRSSYEATSRWHNRELAGGALLDIGVYPLAFSMYMFDESPEDVKNIVYMGDTGVDEEVHLMLDFGGGRSAGVTSSFRYNHPNVARFIFEKGGIFVPEFYHPGEFFVYPEAEAEAGKLPLENASEIENIHPDAGHPAYCYDYGYEGRGYHYEIQSISAEIAAGMSRAEHYSLERTLAVAARMDALRTEWNLRYPGE